MYINKHFSAGINTTSLAESINNLIKYWINVKRTANIKDLFQIINDSYKIFIKNNDVKNNKLTVNLLNNKDIIILSHFQDIVSKYILEKIENQYFLGLNYCVEDLSLEISRVYIPNYISKAKIISFKKKKYLCSCNYSINCGIPCRHIFIFIIKKNIFDVNVLPYNKRWLVTKSNVPNPNKKDNKCLPCPIIITKTGLTSLVNDLNLETGKEVKRKLVIYIYLSIKRPKLNQRQN
jgi:hypothetical protein